MSVLRKISALAVVCLASVSTAQLPDQLAAERVLGPHWRQMARVSGMIFSGTVIEIDSQSVGKGAPLPLMLTTLRVDRAMVGVRAGEVLTVREWTGASSMRRTMTRGERLLIFLYPPSRLGLTSPVGGRFGQVALDARGEIVPANLRSNMLSGAEPTSAAEAVVNSAALAARLRSCPPENPSGGNLRAGGLHVFGSSRQAIGGCVGRSPNPPEEGTLLTRRITLTQLERAIRRARRNPPAGTAAGAKE
jgi:hypothetical protein